MKNYLMIALIIAAVVVSGVLVVFRGSENTWLCVSGQWVKHGVPSAPMPDKLCDGKLATDFQSCADAGYPVLESYPQQCKLPDGQTFIEDIGNGLEKVDLIKVASPSPNQSIESPLAINGEARGVWFFEAVFPIKLLDENNNVLASGNARAMGEWMTEDFVHFEASLSFKRPVTATGTLVLEKDNPSGLPQNADELRIPVKFR